MSQVNESTYTHITVKQDGQRRVNFPGLTQHDLHTLTISWVQGQPAGTLTLSVDGDPGDNNVVALATERVRNFVGKPMFIDMAFAGLPSGCELIVHFR